MKYLITGGAGLIGSYLTERLLADENNSVRILDNFSSGNSKNLEAVQSNPCLEIVEGSILKAENLVEASQNIDFIFHMAASLGVKNVVENPVECLENNFEGTKNVLSQALKRKIPVLYASTSEVYGKSPEPVLSEDGDCLYGPPSISRWGHALSKFLDELIAIHLWRTEGLPTIGVRFFNVVGPRQNPNAGFVLPNFVRQALKNEPLTIYGTGKQIRSFTYVQDAVEAVVKLAQTPEAYGEVFNVGSEQSVTIEELAYRIVELTKSTSVIKKIPYEDVFGKHFEDISKRIPSLAKLRSVIEFTPRYNLDQIITETAEWTREHMG
jgi:UDP-glucose 4-epimerase